jgi:ribosomal protein S18 acetylase RimI-like enzyme
VIVRALVESDLEPLLELQHLLAGEAAPLTAQSLRDVLHDRARGSGAQVRIACDGERVVGAVGWVDGGETFYLSPLLAATAEAARVLVELGLRMGATAQRVRVTTGAPDSHTAGVLAELGFTPHSEFLDLARTTGPLKARDIAPLGWCTLADADPARLLALHNAAFRDVPNTLPMDLEDLAQLVTTALPDASAVIVHGAHPVGYLIAVAHRDPPEPHAEVSVVGVATDVRQRGLGRALVAHALAGARRAGFDEMRALVSSHNHASVELHWRCGFTTRYRRFQWQRGR